MGLKQVKDEILKEAQQKSEELEKEAEKKRKEILEEAEEEIEQIKKEKQNKVEKEKEQLQKQELSEARMEAKNIKLNAKQEEIDKTFEKFEEQIKEQIEPEKYLENCLDKVSYEIGLIKGSSEFAEEVEQRGFKFEEINEEGLILISEDEERRVNFTFNKIFKEFKNQNRKEVAKQLTS